MVSEDDNGASLGDLLGSWTMLLTPCNVDSISEARP